MSLYHVAKADGTRIGPFDVETLNAMLAKGELDTTCLVWAKGMAEWAPITTVTTGEAGAPPETPEPPASATPAVPMPAVPTATAPDAAAADAEKWGLFSSFRSAVTARYMPFFKGRASRAEYWWFFLANFLIGITIGWLPYVGDIVTAVLMVPGVALTVRRLHDTGRSGKYIFFSLIPLVGFIIIFVFMLLPSGPANKWGEGPESPRR